MGEIFVDFSNQIHLWKRMWFYNELVNHYSALDQHNLFSILADKLVVTNLFKVEDVV